MMTCLNGSAPDHLPRATQLPSSPATSVIPIGVVLQHSILPIMGDAAGTDLPNSIVDVNGAGQLLLLGVTGILLAVLGALLPAGWAARTRVAAALRAE
jgi:putative ABC transport system permease protein